MNLNDLLDKALENKAKLDKFKTLTTDVMANAVMIQTISTNALKTASNADHCNKTTIGNKEEELALLNHRQELILLIAYCMSAIEITSGEINRQRKVNHQKK